MKLVLMQFLTLDGVSQGPGASHEDTSDGFTQGGWLVPHIDDAFMQEVRAWTAQADAFLFGHRTYEAFARDWPTQTDPDDRVAASLNGLPKYVASTSLTEATWGPATILSGDVPAKVADLKRLPGRELQVHGSTTLSRSLLAAGLIDELRLAVAPVVLGHGRRLFPDGGAAVGLRLRRNETTPSGLAIQVFEPTGGPTYADYGAASSRGPRPRLPVE